FPQSEPPRLSRGERLLSADSPGVANPCSLPRRRWTLKASSTAYLTKADPVMGRLIERLAPFGLKARRLPPFQYLVRSIIYQQLSGKAAETILGRFEALFGHGRFPKPE